MPSHPLTHPGFGCNMYPPSPPPPPKKKVQTQALKEVEKLKEKETLAPAEEEKKKKKTKTKYTVRRRRKARKTNKQTTTKQSLTASCNHVPDRLVSLLRLGRVLRPRCLGRRQLRPGISPHRQRHGNPVLRGGGGGGGGWGVGTPGGVTVTEELQLAVQENGDQGQVESSNPSLLRLPQSGQSCRCCYCCLCVVVVVVVVFHSAIT